MAQSIGDLFITLGFNVDIQKLNDFENTIKGTANSLKTVAAGLGLATGFYEMAKGVGEASIALDKLNAVYGVSIKAANTWGALVHETWPDVSYSQGRDQFGRVAEYLSKAAFTAQGAMALGRLGVGYNANDLQHPEIILNKLFDRVPALLKQNPQNRALYSSLIGDLTGAPEDIRIFERGRAGLQTAEGNAQFLEKDRLAAEQVARDIAGLQDQWDTFVRHAMGTLAQGVITLEKFIKDAPDKGAAGFFEGVWGWAKTDPYDLPGLGKSLIHNTIMDKAVSATSGFINDSIDKGNIAKMIQKSGWSYEQAQGMAKRLMIESGLSPGAVGDNGQAYGIAQWHPDRQAEFAKVMGRDIRGSSLESQVAFMNYELTKGNERAAGEKLRKTETSEDAYREFTNNYERPAVTVNLTQNVHSNADAQETARITNEGIKGAVLNAYLQQVGVNPQ